MSDTASFTGRQRHRVTRRGVRIADRMAHALIAVGGVGTVVAVSTVFIFLVWVVVPLFLPATIGAPREIAIDTSISDCRALGVDDYRSLAWAMSGDGNFRSFRLDNGQLVSEKAVFADNSPTTWTFGVGNREAVCGFADGSVRIVKFSFSTTFPSVADLPEELQDSHLDKPVVMKEGLLSKTKQGQLRLQTARASAGDPIIPAGGSAIRLVDCSSRPTGRVCAFLTVDDRLALHSVRRRQSLTREVKDSSTVNVDLPFEARKDVGPPKYLLLGGAADNLYLIWDDGYLLRYDVRDPSSPRLAEQVDLLAQLDAKITTVQFLVGKTTLVVGDSLGRVRSWFPTKPADARTNDGMTLVCAQEFRGSAAPVSAVASATRGRQLLVAYEDGSVSVFNATSGRRLLETKDPAAAPCDFAAMAPKADGVVAVGRKSLVEWPIALGFPEVSLTALFQPVWYESYSEPSNVWQSSGGGDDFEPKLGMLPLVFGTLKATFYSLLFAVPLALFSAIYTSEFLHARARARIKPAIEMMASLPSVVLGFVAALVVAPYVERVIPAVIAGIFIVPCTFLLAANLWQLLPQRAGLLLSRWRFAFICATLPIGVLLSAMLGPLLERGLFSGDLHAWLDGQIGNGIGGWVIILLPLSALLCALILSRRVNPYLRTALRGTGRGVRAASELAKSLIAVIATIALALLIAALLDSLHLDPRGTVLETYVQRNALIVGFVMGFAIIPLIFTIADDALSTVPSHLRSASLGAGATPWQTAVRVIIPTAMSGLFSAVMIGLGRAVGETMIALMAAGNTPIIDWNIFNGFQTLSASIATELPEAVQGSAHYRTLFVAALALFAITFVVNTVAEVVRLRFRRRAYEL